MAHAVLGLAFLAVAVVTAAALVALLHTALRPRSTSDVRVASALRELEPRGGRHRFHTRIFEVTVMLAAWSVCLPILALWATSRDDVASAGDARATALFVGGVLAVTTWWCWRRGALRWPSSVSDAERSDG